MFKYIYKCFILSIPFAAVSISTLQPSYLLGLIIVLLFFYQKIQNPKDLKIEITLLIFLNFVIFSLFTPLFIEQPYYTIKPGVDFNNLEFSILTLDIVVLKQLILLLFFLTTYLVLYNLNKNIKFWKISYKYHFIAVSITSFFAVFEYLFEHIFFFEPYSFLKIYSSFKNMDSIERLSVFFPEPSMFAYYMISGLGLVLSNLILRKNISSFMIFSIIVLVGLLSKTTTFYISFIFFLLTFLILYLKYVKKIHTLLSIKLVAISCIFLLVILNNPKVQYFISFLLDSFLQANHGVEISDSYDEIRSIINRLETIKLGMTTFFNFPIFGSGYGTQTILSLLVLLLANTGILGTIAFFLFLRKKFNKKKIKSLSYEEKLEFIAVESSFISVVFAAIISFSFSAFIFLHFWLILALSKSFKKRLE